MNARITRTITAGLLALTAAIPSWLARPAAAQTSRDRAAWTTRTPWGDPELQGEWTTEGEYGVPLERPSQYGTRQYLNK